MRRVGRLIMMMWAGICLGGVSLPPAVLAQSPTAPVIEAGNRGVTLTWTPPPLNITNVDINGKQFSRVEMAGLIGDGQPGQPQLPVYSKLVGLPPAGGATLRVLALETQTVTLPHAPLPVPSPQLISLAQAQFGSPTQTKPDSATYADNTYYPAAVAQLGNPRQIRAWRVAALTIYPVRVNPVTHRAKIVTKLRLEIKFEQPAPATVSAQAETGPFAGALGATLLNPVAAGWSVEPVSAPGAAESPAVSAAATGDVIKVVVKNQGVYALTYADLQAAGLPVATLNPQQLQLSYGAAFSSVAILVEGEADGVFDPGDRVLFYANPTFSRYTDEDVYFLSTNQPSPARMAGRSGNPQGLAAGTAWRSSHAETNKIYDSLYQGYNGDYWYWSKLYQKSSATYAIALPAPLTGSSAATLTVQMRGITSIDGVNPDHKVQAQFNGVSVGVATWDGAQARAAVFSVPGSSLAAGSNQVKLTLPGGTGTVVESMYLDALDITYPTASGSSDQLYFSGEAGPKKYTLAGWSSADLLVFDVTNPLLPQTVTGGQITASGGKYTLTVGDAAATAANYLVTPAGTVKSPVRLEAANLLTDPSAGADYIIITHPNFAAAVAPLAAQRASDGLRVVTVETPAVYDSFGGGRMSPQAIKSFLQHAYQNWPAPAPQYALLVGDGSYDFKNYSGFNSVTYLPPFLADVDPWLGETAADNRFVTFDADNFPDMLIGRLPVNSAVEAGVVVNKILQYETNPALGEWNARHLFVTGSRLDSESTLVSQIFRTYADQSYSRLLSPAVGYRFYYDPDISTTLSYIYNNNVTLRTQFINYFNQGAGIITYNGHSSWHQWNADPVFRWSAVTADNDVTHLKNGRRLPVVLEMTCYTGFFQHPEYPTMDESLLRQSGGGAVAVWGPTGQGVATGHDHLQEGFYDAVIGAKKVKVGVAVLAGKLTLLAGGANLDLLDTFTLFGDPALELNFEVAPYPVQVYLPIIESKGN